ncbi:hypothetical protein RGR602_PC01045 (plasmid) [Rhizobium gallicum bv. gallicum R602sp]|uniref:Uncharacterized protein n=1 Tax=Rhizobium gallicum bv. gallicum R602sp TaxID=1041138 RepID=A0A0B4XD91_9HYPH|nr:hypothetical protein RGR602_PC01045 [Rhizobium gallicum bv. gallicum R602sp]
MFLFQLAYSILSAIAEATLVKDQSLIRNTCSGVHRSKTALARSLASSFRQDSNDEGSVEIEHQ